MFFDLATRAHFKEQCSNIAPLFRVPKTQTTRRQQHVDLIDIVTLYLVTLALTIGIELTIVAVTRQFAPRLRETPTLSTCICINLLTHPLASLAYLGLSFPFLPVELTVILAESIGYRYVGGIPAKWSISLALVTNIGSMIVGFVTF